MFVPRLSRRLDLIRIGGVDAALLEWLGEELDPRFGTSSVLGSPVPLRDVWVDSERGQGRSNAIVDALSDCFAHPEGGPATRWALGVLDIDLYAPGRPFVFGEATVGGCCAILSLARLRPPTSGPADRSLFRRRVLTEAVHELGHVAGLGHCGDLDCVMSESRGIEEVDRKGSDFCRGCRLALADLLAGRGRGEGA